MNKATLTQATTLKQLIDAGLDLYFRVNDRFESVTMSEEAAHFDFFSNEEVSKLQNASGNIGYIGCVFVGATFNLVDGELTIQLKDWVG